MKISTFKRILVLFVLIVVLMGATIVGAVADRKNGFRFLDRFLSPNTTSRTIDNTTVLHEESVVTSVAEKVSPSVVTVSVQTQRRSVLDFSPFGGFEQRIEGGNQQDIGSGFVVSADGLIVTNKHVVSDSTAKYQVITKDGTEYDVTKITRDPANDLAILKIEATNLVPVEMGDSDSIRVGQFAIAIGTALGEFRHTVTTGVISGLGRGITAGSPFQGSAERLDNVIQTDAAINPGNSGGPLLNSLGQVIGVNVAVAEGAQNIGFALPINTVKKGLEQFESTGSFASKAFLGVQYQMISRQAAIANEVPQGAYVAEVIKDSPAEKAGVKVDDIITEINGQNVSANEEGLAGIVSGLKVGDTIRLKIWRDGQTLDVSAPLTGSTQ